MKKFIICLIAVLALCFTANAQYKMTYQTSDGHEYHFVDKSIGIEDNIDFYTTIVNEYNETRREIRNQRIGLITSASCLGVSTALFGISVNRWSETTILIFGTTAVFSTISTILLSFQLGKNQRIGHYQELQLAANGIVIKF